MMSEPNNRRVPAEWELPAAILLAWPHADTDWQYMLEEVEQCYVRLVSALAKWHTVIVVSPDIESVKPHLKDVARDKIIYFQTRTNDTWTRDYGPITLEADGKVNAVDFCFNAWGMKFAACYDNLVTQKLCDSSLITAPRINCRNFVLEGGSIESDGKGTLLTTSECLLSPNRNAPMNRAEIERYLHDVLGFSHQLWLDHGYLAGDDTDSHIDTLARIAPHDTILYVGCTNPEDEHYHELDAMKRQLMEMRTPEGMPYSLIELPMPDAIFDEEGERLPATYANFLVTDKAIFMPSYGQKRNDELAAQIVQIAFGLPVEQIDCRALIKQHGSLHCATMQIPLKSLCIDE